MASYLIKHTKDDEIKFVGHLDLFQAIMRNVTRADLKAKYSNGFNPHMQISGAQPLPVGVSSESEYFLLELKEEMDEDEILKRLNNTSPKPIRYLMVKRVKDGTKSPMALLGAIKTRMVIKSNEDFEKGVNALLSSDDPLTYKRVTKKGNEIETDMKGYILDYKTSYENGETTLEVITKAGSTEHLSPDHLLDYLKERVSGVDKDAFVRVKRLEMYTYNDKILKRLDEI